MTGWLKRMWLPLLLIAVNMIVFGPGAKYIVAFFGNGLDDVCTTIFNVSACFLVVVMIDLAFDKREGWGIFQTLDVDAAIKQAMRSPIGSGLVWLGYVILFSVILIICAQRAHGSTLDRAKPYLPTLSRAIDMEWPTVILRHYPAGQVEKESGWNPKATLKTSRELGRGLVQPTIAWDKTGKERFNAYKDAMAYKSMRDWNWRDDPFNASYQLKLLVLRDRDSFRQVRPFMMNDEEAMKVSMVFFNAGGGRYQARKNYARLHGFKTDRWDGGLAEAHGPKENVTLYGRPLWVAVNEYPRMIGKLSEKYRGLV
jgi:hypothetical protein